jgi:hypothetical protein
MLEGAYLFIAFSTQFLILFYFGLGEQIDWPVLEMAFKNTLGEGEKIEDYLRSDLEDVTPAIESMISNDADNLHGSDEIAKDHEASRNLQEQLEASVKMLLGKYSQ